MTFWGLPALIYSYFSGIEETCCNEEISGNYAYVSNTVNYIILYLVFLFQSTGRSRG